MPPTEHKTEKKKKRKRDKQEETTISEAPSTFESKKERKEKKRRTKMENAVQDTFTSSTPAEVPSTPSRSSPKSQISSTPSVADATAFLAKHSITIHNPSNIQFTPIINFSQLDIPSDLRSSFDGFKEPTPIQACTWPPALDGRDVVGIAETGRYT